MSVKFLEKSACNGCHACYSICPKNCIYMDTDKEGFWYPVINEQICINCHLCENVCPILKEAKEAATEKIRKKSSNCLTYAAYHKNDTIRRESSSGGVFSALAEWILNQDGLVYGAKFNEHLQVVHGSITAIEELNQLRGSKYVQSRIGDVYKEVKEALNSGRLVLFSGTPCQIGGIQSYLGKSYENLICQDLICHGVPSPMVLERYKDYREAVSDGKIQKILFRHKKYGWRKYSVAFEFSNSTEYLEKNDKDPYMKAFLANLSLRPSCYQCRFKLPPGYRQSDITLADFWGIEQVLPELDDDKGTSLIFLNSEKGQQLFEHIKKELNYQKVSAKEAILHNPSMVSSVLYPAKRKKFLQKIRKEDFKQVTEQACKRGVFRKSCDIGKRILKKMYQRVSR